MIPVWNNKKVFFMLIWDHDLETGGGGGNDAFNVVFSCLENSICDLKRNIVDFFKTYFYQRKRNELGYSRRKCVWTLQTSDCLLLCNNISDQESIFNHDSSRSKIQMRGLLLFLDKYKDQKAHLLRRKPIIRGTMYH